MGKYFYLFYILYIVKYVKCNYSKDFQYDFKYHTNTLCSDLYSVASSNVTLKTYKKYKLLLHIFSVNNKQTTCLKESEVAFPSSEISSHLFPLLKKRLTFDVLSAFYLLACFKTYFFHQYGGYFNDFTLIPKELFRRGSLNAYINAYALDMFYMKPADQSTRVGLPH